LRLLLDTHIWLWTMLEPDRLGATLATEIDDPNNELWLSPISVWEAMRLAERQRIVIEGSSELWLRAAFREVPVRDATLNRDVAITSRTIDLPHEDPADRFIAATAVVHELTLATADARLLACGAFETLPSR
jgi:PIN domain nuclease of toxin-antitoxin system